MSVPTLNGNDKIDEFHWHEVVDRTWLIMETLANALEDHPVILAHPDLAKKMGVAHTALFDLYQSAAAIHMAAIRDGRSGK